MDWQPIETAPMTPNEEILLLIDGVPQSGFWWEQPFIESRDRDGNYIDQQDGDAGWCSYRNGIDINPTHWMPLPPPPKS